MTAYLTAMRSAFLSPASIFMPMAPAERTDRHAGLQGDVARIAADFRKLLPVGTDTGTLEDEAAALLPSAAVLRDLDTIIHNGAERYFNMVEAEQAHRLHRMEANLMQARRGQWMGCTIICSALVGAVFIALSGGPWQIGVALVSLPVAAIVLSLQARR